MASDNEEVNPTSIQFKHFDPELQVPSDHHFIKSNKSNTSRTGFHNKIMKEWKILEKNLPESIYVHTYETRIDLLRAVIIGPAGTPYHDGLFFFDIVLPSDYPNQPPKVHYRSHGYRLNPNLYSNGTVCLSLINTWSGNKYEKWTKESTILQLLVSIQGLVLNENPYFNEPGYEVGKNSTSWKWINPAREYNEDAFVLSCKTMVQILKKPPEDFESFVARHFEEKADSILAAVEAYAKGRVRVGYFRTNGVDSSNTVQVSTKFKSNLTKIRSELVKAFAMKISPPNSNEPANVENESKLRGANSKKRNGKAKSGKNSKKWKRKNDLSSSVKNQEDVGKGKNWVWGKMSSLVKWIFG